MTAAVPSTHDHDGRTTGDQAQVTPQVVLERTLTEMEG